MKSRRSLVLLTMIKISTPNEGVTSVLSAHIKKNVKEWHRHIVRKPVTYEDFSKWQIPSKDLPVAISSDTLLLPEGADAVPVQTAKNLLGATRVTNASVYSPMSGMFWHTNSNLEGTRVYYTFSLDRSVFKYKDPSTGEEHESWDDVGWTCRTFDVVKDRPLWHCIWTSGRRFSFGFML